MKKVILAAGFIWLLILSVGMTKAFAGQTCFTDCNEFSCTTHCSENYM